MEIDGLFSFVELVAVAEAASTITQTKISKIHELQQLAERRQGWLNLQGWEALNDSEILKLVLGPFLQTEEIYVVSDLSYQSERGAFSVPAGQLVAFVDSYFDSFGEALFDGDVVLVCPSQQTLWLFHHEGMALQWTHD